MLLTKRQRDFDPGILGEVGDRIVYLAVSKGGGIDGMDRSDKPGVVCRAAFDEAKVALDGWTTLEKRVINLQEAQQAALAKLDPVDRLVLGLPPKD